MGRLVNLLTKLGVIVNIRLFGNTFPLPQANRLWQIGLVVVMVLLCNPDQSTAQMRTWKSGAHEVEAELVKTDGTGPKMQVVLKNEKGQELAIPISILSEADQQYINAYLESKGETPWAPEGAEGGAAAKPPEKEVDTPKPVPEKTPAVPKEEIKSKTPALVIPTRPIDLPQLRSRAQFENFDENSAIRIGEEEKVELDVRGFSKEVPVYTVDVDIEELKKLPNEQRTIAAILISNKTSRVQRLSAIEALAKNWPRQRSQALINLTVNQASDKSKFVRMAAMDILAVHDAEDSLKYILVRIDDKSVDVRARAFELLGRIRDPRVIPELCSRLDSADRMNIHMALKPFGPAASKWVLPWLKPDAPKLVVIEACDLLGDLGGEGVVEALQQKQASSESVLVKSQAENSIKRLQSASQGLSEQGRGAFSPQ